MQPTMPPIGELDRSLTIQYKSVTQDAAYGSEVVTWSTYASGVRAKFMEEGGLEAVAQSQRVGTSRVTIVIRWQAGITAAMRVLEPATGRVLEIMGISEIPRRRGLSMTCEDYTV